MVYATEAEAEIAKLRSLLKDKEDEICKLKLLIGTGVPPGIVCLQHKALFIWIRFC